MLQLALAASVAPQASVPVAIAKSVGLEPPIVILLMFMVALPVLERIATIEEDVPFTVVFGKDSAAVRDAIGADAASTLNVTEFEIPPPGEGLVTVTAGVPALFTSLARIAAVT